MEEKKEDNQICKNCKYFVRHYVKYKTYFHPLNCGHCSNFKLSRDKRHSCPVNYCGRWEQAEEVDSADEMRQIANAIVNMQKHLKDITSILSFMKTQ